MSPLQRHHFFVGTSSLFVVLTYWGNVVWLTSLEMRESYECRIEIRAHSTRHCKLILNHRWIFFLIATVLCFFISSRFFLFNLMLFCSGPLAFSRPSAFATIHACTIDTMTSCPINSSHVFASAQFPYECHRICWSLSKAAVNMLLPIDWAASGHLVRVGRFIWFNRPMYVKPTRVQYRWWRWIGMVISREWRWRYAGISSAE